MSAVGIVQGLPSARSPGNPRLRTRHWIARLGLPTCLVLVLVVPSSLYIGGMVLVNQRSVQWLFQDPSHGLTHQHDAPELHRPSQNRTAVATNSKWTIDPVADPVTMDTIAGRLDTTSTTHGTSTTNFPLVRSVPPNRTGKIIQTDKNDKSPTGQVVEDEIQEDESQNDDDKGNNNIHNDDDDDEESDTPKQSNHSSEDTIPPTNTTNTRTARTMQHKLALRNRSNSTLPNRTIIIPFAKQVGVVIVTKIHGPHQLDVLQQALCLLHFAYNRRPKYDIVVFTTIPVLPESIAPIQTMIHPIKITFVMDNRGLQEEIAALSPLRYQTFLKACQVDTPQNLTWWSQCPGRIAYNWQAEFRAWHLWKHPALESYQWMMWIDADAFCTKEWTIDPIQVMIENDLVILFDNWPKGHHVGKDVERKIWDAFGVYICTLRLSQGHFFSKLRNATCRGARVGDIHGFLHITNLEFYRSDIVQEWAQIWIGNGFLQRRYDDQSAVTIPAAILAPERAWDMRRNKIRLDVFHNFDLDGKRGDRVGGFKKFWKKNARSRFPEAVDACTITATG